jgi:cell division protein YceG involved in septum cleavage
MDEKKPMPKFVMTPSDNGAYQKMDELLKYMKVIASQREHQKIIEKVSTDPEEVKQLTEEANKKILEKIDELGVKFSKIEPDVKEKTGKKSIPTEMSQEEILQLLQRIDKMESKLTRAISEARISSAATITRGRKLDDMAGDVPKIGKIEGGDAMPQAAEDRPLLDDVLSTVIVSVEKDEE